MNIVITGATGLIASHIAEFLKSKKISVFTPSSSELDIRSEQSVLTYCNNIKPNLIIHCAAYTDVTDADAQRNNKEGTAWILNVIGTQNIIKTTHEHNSQLIHISTDMVFSGKKDDPGPYKEDHAIETESGRLSWYGFTKAEAERLIVNNVKNYTILRPSNPTRAHYDKKLDYVRKILFAFDQNKPIRLFDDQHLSLTYINEISEAILTIIEKKLHGIFHVSSSNLFTPYNLAVYLLKKARNADNIVNRSSLEDFFKQTGNSNRYVQYGGLDVKQTEEKLGMKFRTWEEVIDSLIKEKM